MPLNPPGYFAPSYWPPGWTGSVSVIPSVSGRRDLLKIGLATLTAKLSQSASQNIVYMRGTDYVETVATLGSKLLKLDDGEGGVRMQWTDMDFLIPAEGFEFDGEPIVPQRGDRVRLLAGEAIEEFEVMPFGGDAPWRWSDPHQSMFRVHTKHIGDEPYSL